MHNLFSPAFIDHFGTALLYVLVALFIVKVVTPDHLRERIRNAFSGPVSWFHKHIA